MSDKWMHSVNQIVGTTKINDINNYVECCDFKYESPIDKFYSSTFEVLKVGTPEFFKENQKLASLFVVGLVSAAENYFRDILSSIIRICPLAQRTASEQSINLGSVVWHGFGQVERGAFEHLSFADQEIIKKTCNKFIDFAINDNSPIDIILREFDKVCELRHGIVHSSSVLPGKNAVKLQIPGDRGPISIKIEFQQLQECALICNSLVATFNCFLFKEMCRRWAIVWPKENTWVDSKKKEKFIFIWKTFFSKIDNDRHNIPFSISRTKCRNLIMKQFNIT